MINVPSGTRIHPERPKSVTSKAQSTSQGGKPAANSSTGASINSIASATAQIASAA